MERTCRRCFIHTSKEPPPSPPHPSSAARGSLSPRRGLVALGDIPGWPCLPWNPTGSKVSAAPLLVLCTAEPGSCLRAGNEAFAKLIKTTEARRKGKLISHGNQLDLIQKNKQRVRSVSLAGCFSGKGITRRFPPKGMALCCCSLCNWGFRSGTKSHYHKISLSEGKKLTFAKAREGAAKHGGSMGTDGEGASLGHGGQPARGRGAGG